MSRPRNRGSHCLKDMGQVVESEYLEVERRQYHEQIRRERWRSASEVGRWDKVEVQPYERTVEDPHEMEMAQAQRVRRARERSR